MLNKTAKKDNEILQEELKVDTTKCQGNNNIKYLIFSFKDIGYTIQSLNCNLFEHPLCKQPFNKIFHPTTLATARNSIHRFLQKGGKSLASKDA